MDAQSWDIDGAIEDWLSQNPSKHARPDDNVFLRDEEWSSDSSDNGGSEGEGEGVDDTLDEMVKKAEREISKENSRSSIHPSGANQRTTGLAGSRTVNGVITNDTSDSDEVPLLDKRKNRTHILGKQPVNSEHITQESTLPQPPQHPDSLQPRQVPLQQEKTATPAQPASRPTQPFTPFTPYDNERTILYDAPPTTLNSRATRDASKLLVEEFTTLNTPPTEKAAKPLPKEEERPATQHLPPKTAQHPPQRQRGDSQDAFFTDPTPYRPSTQPPRAHTQPLQPSPPLKPVTEEVPRRTSPSPYSAPLGQHQFASESPALSSRWAVGRDDHTTFPTTPFSSSTPRAESYLSQLPLGGTKHQNNIMGGEEEGADFSYYRDSVRKMNNVGPAVNGRERARGMEKGKEKEREKEREEERDEHHLMRGRERDGKRPPVYNMRDGDDVDDHREKDREKSMAPEYRDFNWPLRENEKQRDRDIPFKRGTNNNKEERETAGEKKRTKAAMQRDEVFDTLPMKKEVSFKDDRRSDSDSKKDKRKGKHEENHSRHHHHRVEENEEKDFDYEYYGGHLDSLVQRETRTAKANFHGIMDWYALHQLLLRNGFEGLPFVTRPKDQFRSSPFNERALYQTIEELLVQFERRGLLVQEMIKGSKESKAEVQRKEREAATLSTECEELRKGWQTAEDRILEIQRNTLLERKQKAEEHEKLRLENQALKAELKRRDSIIAEKDSETEQLRQSLKHYMHLDMARFERDKTILENLVGREANESDLAALRKEKLIERRRGRRSEEREEDESHFYHPALNGHNRKGAGSSAGSGEESHHRSRRSTTEESLQKKHIQKGKEKVRDASRDEDDEERDSEEGEAGTGAYGSHHRKLAASMRRGGEKKGRVGRYSDDDEDDKAEGFADPPAAREKPSSGGGRDSSGLGGERYLSPATTSSMRTPTSPPQPQRSKNPTMAQLEEQLHEIQGWIKDFTS